MIYAKNTLNCLIYLTLSNATNYFQIIFNVEDRNDTNRYLKER